MEGLIHSVTECNEEEIYTTEQLAKEAEALTLVTELFERLTEREGQLTEANRLLVREKARNEVCVCVRARLLHLVDAPTMFHRCNRVQLSVTINQHYPVL